MNDKELLGDAHAYIKVGQAKAQYPRIGSAFRDERGQISLKIDTLPLPGSGWTGWINIFPRKASGQKAINKEFADDDIPF